MISIPFLKEFLQNLRSVSLDDLVDRCHYLFTGVLLVLFAAVVGSKQTFGSPIACITPAEYPSQWSDYVHDYCFVTKTYLAPPLDEYGHVTAPNVEINYYQWVPYVLALQAIFFYLPHFIWVSLEKSADLDMRTTVEEAVRIRALTNDKRQEGIQSIAKYLTQIAEFRRSRGSSGLGYWCTAVYLTSKFLALINLVVQFHVVNSVVGEGRGDWGLDVIRNAVNGVYWQETGLFPRTSYCYFEQAVLANVNAKWVQCALMVNMLNEKVFVAIYIWFAVLMLPTSIDFLYSTFIVVVSYLRLWFAKRYVEPTRTLSYNPMLKFGRLEADRRVTKFVFQVLGADGFLLLRFVHTHAGHLVASEIARGLFKQWEEQQAQRPHHINHGFGSFAIRSELDENEHRLLSQQDKGFSTA